MWSSLQSGQKNARSDKTVTVVGYSLANVHGISCRSAGSGRGTHDGVFGPFGLVEPFVALEPPVEKGRAGARDDDGIAKSLWVHFAVGSRAAQEIEDSRFHAEYRVVRVERQGGKRAKHKGVDVEVDPAVLLQHLEADDIGLVRVLPLASSVTNACVWETKLIRHGKSDQKDAAPDGSCEGHHTHMMHWPTALAHVLHIPRPQDFKLAPDYAIVVGPSLTRSHQYPRGSLTQWNKTRSGFSTIRADRIAR